MSDLTPLPSLPPLRLRPLPGDRVAVTFPYHPQTVECIRQVPGRRWHPQDRRWSIPRTPESIGILQRLFGGDPPPEAPAATRPAAVTRRRWDALSAAEQAFIAPVEDEMKLRGYSPRTRKCYRSHLLRFRGHFSGRDLDDLDAGDIRRYLLALVEQHGVSRSYLNQAVSAIKLLFHQVLRRPEEIADIPRPRHDG